MNATHGQGIRQRDAPDRQDGGRGRPGRVLLIEDERALRRALAMNLTARGYAVVEAATGTAGLAAAAQSEPDVIVLDLGLPDLDGVDVVRGVRAYSHTPIIVLSARTGSTEKVRALDAGADDYVTKPFNVDELLARLRAATRRAGATEVHATVAIGDVTVDLAATTATRTDGSAVRLTPTEWRLLAELLHSPGRLVTGRPCCGRCAARRTTPTRVTCASTSASCAASSNPNPRAPATCSPSRAWGTASSREPGRGAAPDPPPSDANSPITRASLLR